MVDGKTPSTIRHRPLTIDHRPLSINQAAGVGIEPTSRRSERRILPLDDPAHQCFRPETGGEGSGSSLSSGFQPQVSGLTSSGGRTRTCNRLLNKELPYHWATPLGTNCCRLLSACSFGRPDCQSAWSGLNRRSRAPEARGLLAFPHAEEVDGRWREYLVRPWTIVERHQVAGPGAATGDRSL